VARAGFNTEGFLFGEPTQVAALEASLVRQLSSEPPSANAIDRLLAPHTMALLTALWPQSRLASTACVAASDASAACQRLVADEATARALMDDLLASDIVREKDGAFSLDDEWKPWLERVWSGESFEVEVAPLPEGRFDPAQLLEHRERLVFVGPSGRCIASRAVDATSFAEIPLGVSLLDDQAEPLLALSYLDDASLAWVLGTLLRLTGEGLRGHAPDAPATAGSPPPKGTSRN
jgi:hypothetical protein